MKTYQSLLRYIMNNGTDREDRTGTGTRSVFGYQWRHSLQSGFPLLTTKRVHIKSVIHELLWIISGSTNNNDLKKHGVTIWDEWAKEDGDLGPIYGDQWRFWTSPQKAIATFPDGAQSGSRESIQITHGTVDQLTVLIDGLKNNPFSRRHIVTAWNPTVLDQVCMPACHAFWQCYVSEKEGKRSLSLSLYIRSSDAFLGLPFNIASYAFLTHMLADVCGYDVGDLIISFGDLHIYKNHFDQVNEQLARVPRALPMLTLDHRDTINQFTIDDFHIHRYDPLPAIKAPVSV